MDCNKKIESPKIEITGKSVDYKGCNLENVVHSFDIGEIDFEVNIQETKFGINDYVKNYIVKFKPCNLIFSNKSKQEEKLELVKDKENSFSVNGNVNTSFGGIDFKFEIAME
jgi:hypothetical protein